MEITCSRSPVRSAILLVRTREAFITKLLTADVRPVQMTVPNRPDAGLKQERSSAKFSKFRSHSCLSGWPMTTVQKTPSFIKPDAHLSPQPINRGFCAWELQEFGIEFHYCLESYFVRLLSWIVLSKAVAVCAVAALKLRSILGVGPKVKDFIEDPFR